MTEQSEMERRSDELLAALAPRLAAPVPPGVLERVRRNVRAAGRRRSRPAMRAGLAALAAAAAIVLAAGFDARRGLSAAAEADPAVALEAWADASAETELSFTRLGHEGWLDADAPTDRDDAAADAFESVEQTFDAFADALGA